jgi:hypothetical protein
MSIVLANEVRPRSEDFFTLMAYHINTDVMQNCCAIREIYGIKTELWRKNCAE